MELEEMLFCCLPGDLLVLKLLLSPLKWREIKNHAKYHCTRINQEKSHFPEGGQRERGTLRWGGRNGKLKEDDPDGRGKKYSALLPPN